MLTFAADAPAGADAAVGAKELAEGGPTTNATAEATPCCVSSEPGCSNGVSYRGEAADCVSLPHDKVSSGATCAPLDRSPPLIERAVVLFFGITILGQIYCWIMALTWALNSALFAVALALYAAVFLFGPGFAAAETDSPHEPPLRRWSLWAHFQRFFDARLIKTAGATCFSCIFSCCRASAFFILVALAAGCSVFNC